MDYYSVTEENLPTLIGGLLDDFSFLEEMDENILIQRFKEYFPYNPIEGTYVFNEEQINDFLSSLKINLAAEAMWQLVKQNKIELYWDCEKDDFAFKQKV